MLHSLLRLLSLLLIVGSPLLAQQDHRVSIEPTTAVLPEEARIQAAGSIGSNTLVVWGGNRAEGIDTAISVLHSQLLRDTVAEGSPRQLHSDEARPWGFVSVVPFDDRYLVLWNDRRTVVPGVYMQWLDRDGIPMGSEQIFSHRFIPDSASLKAFRTASGVTIFRAERNIVSRLFMRRLMFDGSPLQDEVEITLGNVVDVERLAGFENLFRVRVDSLVYLLGEDGRFDSRSIPSDRFDGAWYMGSDSTFVTLRETTLHYYPTPFETTPQRSVTLTALRSIEAPGAVITADSSGVQVTYPVCNLMEGPKYSAMVRIWAKRIVINPTGGVSPPVAIDSIARSYVGAGTDIETMGAITTARRCGNSYSVRVNYSVSYYDGRQTVHYGTHQKQWGYSVGPFGEYLAEPVERPIAPCYDAAGNLAQPVVSRTDFVDSSTVRIADNTLPTVGTPVSRFAVDAAQGSPNIFRRNDHLMLTWTETGGTFANVLAGWSPEDNVAKMISKSPFAVSPLRMLTTTALSHAGTWTLNDRSGSKDFIRLTLQMADSQWSTRLSDQYGQTDGVVAATVDPNRNESMMLLDFVTYNRSERLSAYWIDSMGINIREMPLDPSQGLLMSAVIAVDSSTILIYSRERKRFIEIHDGVQKESFPFEAGTDSVLCLRRLYGPRFLRYIPATAAKDPHFDIFSLQGTREAGLNLQISRDYTNPFFVESPVDSTIHILWASNNGVRLTRLDKYLRVLVRDSLISQTGDSVRSLAGVFRNDTLFAIWQDFRNTTPDIYATSFVSKRSSSRSRETDQSVTVRAITPNPATGVATFALELSEPGVAVAEILNVTGQVIIRQTRHFDAGVQRWEIDVRDLANGLYLLSVQSGGKVSMTKLMVMQE